jgi:hypothetical protein
MSGMTGQNTERATVIPPHGSGRLMPQWPKGATPNPGGRPAGMKYLRDSCRKLCADGVVALSRIVTETVIDEQGREHNAHDGKVVVAAVQILFTWAYGKPPEYDPREDRPPLAIDTSILSPAERALLLSLMRRGLVKEAEVEPAREEAPRIDGEVEP